MAEGGNRVNIQVTPVAAFDPHGDTAGVHQRWERWLRSFEIFADASGCANDHQKKQLFLHCAGTDVQDIFYTFAEPRPDTYDAAKNELTTYFRPAKNVTYNRHVFRQMAQEEDETMAQFVTRLRQLAKDCDFENKTDEFIRDQVIDKCKSEQLRTKFLAEKDLTLQKVLSFSAAKELSEKQSSLISGEKAFAVRNKPKHSGFKSSSNNSKAEVKCGRCGKNGHLSKDCRCTKDVKCFNCDKFGHFASVCRNKKHDENKSRKRTEHKQGKSSKNLRYVEKESENESEGSEEDYSYVFAVKNRDGEVTVIIDDEPIQMIIDSGASINILNSRAAAKLKNRGLEFTECRKTIHPYGSPPITAKKAVRATAEIAGHQSTTAEFIVIPGSQPCLLGRQTSEELGVLKINVNHVTHSILDQFPGIADGIGKLKDFEVKIHVDPTVTPVARKHSRVPFHLRHKVKEELDKLEKEDAIEKVSSSSSTEWVSRIVVAPKPKNPDEIRICVDMRDANKAIKRTRHVPTLEELVEEMNGATVFSKIDLRSGYHQLKLQESSRGITTFSTHAGLYRYKRLSFGINSAAEIFQHTIQTVIADVPGAKNVSDDIIVHGRNTEEHDKRLNLLLSTLHKAGLTVNRAKCQFRKSEIEFYGLIFSADGLKPDPAKVSALNNTAEPQNQKELRSFLGMAQYSSRFIPDFATLTEPLRQLTKQDVPWTWGEAESKAFTGIKQALCNFTTLQYFDTKKPSEVYVDASPVGVAAFLSQEGKPVCYASRALSEVEQRYSQTEREALGIIWACEHFDIYLRGNSFKVITDHKPLTTIWSKPSPPARIARWALRLQPYKVTVVYKPGKDNPADYLSRHPTASFKSSRAEKAAEEFVRFVTETNTPVAVTIDEIKEATMTDPALRQIIEIIETGQWHVRPSDISKDTFQAYQNAKESLSVNAERNIVLKGTLIVVPQALENRIIKLAHEGHQGINKTKELLRSKVWFPGITAKTETAINSCIPCQANSNRKSLEPLAMSKLPAGPWQDLSMDFCGPLPTGESLLVVQDEYSRYPVVEVVRKTSVQSIIPVVDKIFAEFGFPKQIKTDNGPQFRASAWRDYLNACGVKHRKITPLWPRANAQAESFNKPLMKAIRAAKLQGQNWKQEMYKFLRMYRATPHSTTQFSPFFLLLGREPRTKLPQVSSANHPCDVEVRQRDAAAKAKMKEVADKRNRAKNHNITCGDIVLMKQPKIDKMSTPYLPKPMRVQDNKGSMVTVVRPDGSTVTRNASQFKRMPPSTLPAEPDEDNYADEGTTDITTDEGIDNHDRNSTSKPRRLSQISPVAKQTEQSVPLSSGPTPQSVPSPIHQSNPDPLPKPPTRRSDRQTKEPVRFKDYVMKK